ncbi:hypothetical protein ML401_39140 (plasmid) [Bradyrhizobium sp. 62B]|nr:hypothetical protein ML401_39140 [Bradyrhizobium sp. 62B]
MATTPLMDPSIAVLGASFMSESPYLSSISIGVHKSFAFWHRMQDFDSLMRHMGEIQPMPPIIFA